MPTSLTFSIFPSIKISIVSPSITLVTKILFILSEGRYFKFIGSTQQVEIKKKITISIFSYF